MGVEQNCGQDCELAEMKNGPGFVDTELYEKS